MVSVYIRRKNETVGHTFICKESIKEDKVGILPFTFVTKGLITEEEWTNSKQTLIDKFELYVTESYIDGRCNEARNMKSFSWGDILEMEVKDTFNPNGYKSVGGFFGAGMEIEVSNCNSMVRYRIGEKMAPSKWLEILYNRKGEPYFIAGGRKEYLKQFTNL